MDQVHGAHTLSWCQWCALARRGRSLSVGLNGVTSIHVMDPLRTLVVII